MTAYWKDVAVPGDMRDALAIAEPEIERALLQDIALLLSILDGQIEATGESLDVEDAAIVYQIRRERGTDLALKEGT